MNIRHFFARPVVFFTAFVIVHTGSAQPCKLLNWDNFPDADYVTSIDNMRFGDGFGGNCDIWECGQDLTGPRCTENCFTGDPLENPCDQGEFWQICDAPLLASCVSCKQSGTPEIGYSFDVYANVVERYDLLNRRGSFEYAKLYPTSLNNAGGQHFMTIRTALKNLPAVDTSWQSTPPVLWDDVMFPGIYIGLQFYGVGTMKLIHGQGAFHSNVFLDMSAPYAKLLVVGIETDDTFQKEMYGTLVLQESLPPFPDRADESVSVDQLNHVRGLIYEFHYRQRVFTDSPDISVTAALVIARRTVEDIINVETRIQVTELLPSKSSWTRHVGMLDYAEDAQEAPEDAGLSLEFETAPGKDVLLDDVHVFANLFGNGRFSREGSWTRSCISDYQCELNQNDWLIGDKFFASLGATDSIDQRVHLRTDTGSAGHKETAQFVLDVRGSGLLIVTSYLSGYPENIFHFRKKLNGNDGLWQTVNFQVILYVKSPLSRNPVFRIENGGSTGADVLYIDNVFLYVDPRECPPNTDPVTNLVICDDPVNRAFVNGRCELCENDEGGAVARCGIGEYQHGCIVTYGGMQAECTGCKIPTGPVDMNWEGVFVESLLECTYRCAAGFYYSRGETNPLYGAPSTYSPTCKECTPNSALKCPTGWRNAECEGENDSVCVPCDTLDPQDRSVVYTTSGAADNNNHECTHKCAPDQFQYGVRQAVVPGSFGASPLCFHCTPGICGAKDDGLSTPRSRDGFQYTSECLATTDSQCMSCKSADDKLVFTHNGNFIGTWCKYECLPGYRPRAPCAWDAARAIDVSPSLEQRWSALFGLGNITGKIPVDPWLLVRFSGRATVQSAAFGVQVVLRVRVESTDGAIWYPPGETGVLFHVQPVVPSASVASMTATKTFIRDAPVQTFDSILEMRDYTNTASFNEWNNARPSTGTILHLVYVLSLHNGVPLTTQGNISVSEFTVQTIILARDCCETRNASTSSPGGFIALDPAAIQRCYPCDDPQGDSSSTLPVHAHWVSGDNSSCAWACDKHYELTIGLCKFCIQPICPTGTYWTACGKCENCAPTPPLNAVFTANGTTRHDPTSCPFKCANGFYYTDFTGNFAGNFAGDFVGNGSCARCSSSTALACSTSPGGPFFETPCTESQDAVCVNCLICPIGYNATVPCGQFKNVVCEKCDVSLLTPIPPGIGVLDGGAEWRLGTSTDQYCEWGCMNGLQYNPLENTCFTCANSNCPVGFYPTPCTAGNLFTPCSRCDTPKNALVISAGSMSRINSCAWECGAENVYNQTLHRCMPRPIIPVKRLDAEWIQGNEEPPCDTTLPGVCEWGQWLDASVVVTNGDPCTAMCVNCTRNPQIGVEEGSRVYIHKGSCDWVCSHPFIQIGGKCQRIATQM